MWVFGYLQAPEHGERRVMCCGDTTWTPSGGLQPAWGPRQNTSAGSLLLLLPCTGCGQRCGDRCHSAWAAPGLPRTCSSRPEGMMPTQAIKRPANNKSRLTAQEYLVISLLTKNFRKLYMSLRPHGNHIPEHRISFSSVTFLMQASNPSTKADLVL